jgi:hypothetical protein
MSFTIFKSHIIVIIVKKSCKNSSGISSLNKMLLFGKSGIPTMLKTTIENIFLFFIVCLYSSCDPHDNTPRFASYKIPVGQGTRGCAGSAPDKSACPRASARKRRARSPDAGTDTAATQGPLRLGAAAGRYGQNGHTKKDRRDRFSCVHCSSPFIYRIRKFPVLGSH